MRLRFRTVALLSIPRCTGRSKSMAAMAAMSSALAELGRRPLAYPQQAAPPARSPTSRNSEREGWRGVGCSLQSAHTPMPIKARSSREGGATEPS
eukprot:7909396-Alexandrium_andersonii.AAC.1